MSIGPRLRLGALSVAASLAVTALAVGSPNALPAPVTLDDVTQIGFGGRAVAYIEGCA
jgi:hypothetical protein